MVQLEHIPDTDLCLPNICECCAFAADGFGRCVLAVITDGAKSDQWDAICIIFRCSGDKIGRGDHIADAPSRIEHIAKIVNIRADLEALFFALQFEAWLKALRKYR